MSAFLHQRHEALTVALERAVLASHYAPLRLVSVANGSRGLSMGALRMQADKKKTQRQVGFAAGETFRRFLSPKAPFHVVVVTRISPRGLDPHDNLGHAMKSVIDGCAAALGVNDRDSRVRYVPSQQQGVEGEFGVRLELFAAPVVDGMVGLHNWHSDECMAVLTDPGAECVCRPPAVAEPVVGKLSLPIGKGDAMRMRCSIAPTPNVVRNRK